MLALGQLAGGIAHDFNNILAIIDGYSQRLQKRFKDSDPDAAEMLEPIRSAAQRGTKLVQELLIFGRKKTATVELLDLCELLRAQESILRPLLGTAYRIEWRLPETACIIKGQADWLAQVVMNLCVNARDAMPRGGAIKISAERCSIEEVPLTIADIRHQSDYVLLRVTDTGTGISDEIKNSIFDPFFTTKDQGQGTGLGLSMVYGTVKSMGGEVLVDSYEGLGTSFRIYFPLYDACVQHGDEESAGQMTGGGETILVAEDEPHLLELMRQNLEEAGYHVLCAQNGNEALLVQDEYEGPIHLLLTDVVMPELGGPRLAELIAEVRSETAVIFMTGHASRQASNSSAMLFPPKASVMSKPVDPEALLLKIRAKLSRAESDSSSH